MGLRYGKFLLTISGNPGMVLWCDRFFFSGRSSVKWSRPWVALEPANPGSPRSFCIWTDSAPTIVWNRRSPCPHRHSLSVCGGVGTARRETTTKTTTTPPVCRLVVVLTKPATRDEEKASTNTQAMGGTSIPTTVTRTTTTTTTRPLWRHPRRSTASHHSTSRNHTNKNDVEQGLAVVVDVWTPTKTKDMAIGSSFTNPDHHKNDDNNDNDKTTPNKDHFPPNTTFVSSPQNTQVSSNHDSTTTGPKKGTAVVAVPRHVYVVLCGSTISLSAIGPLLELQQTVVSPLLQVVWRMTATAMVLTPFVVTQWMYQSWDRQSCWFHQGSWSLSSFVSSFFFLLPKRARRTRTITRNPSSSERRPPTRTVSRSSTSSSSSSCSWRTLVSQLLQTAVCYMVLCHGFVVALQSTSVGTAVTLSNSQSLWLLLAKVVWMRHAVSRAELVGALVAFCGVLVLCSGSDGTSSSTVSSSSLSFPWWPQQHDWIPHPNGFTPEDAQSPNKAVSFSTHVLDSMDDWSSILWSTSSSWMEEPWWWWTQDSYSLSSWMDLVGTTDTTSSSSPLRGNLYALASALGGVGYLLNAQAVRRHVPRVADFLCSLMILSSLGSILVLYGMGWWSTSTSTTTPSFLSSSSSSSSVVVVTWNTHVDHGLFGWMTVDRWDRLPLELLMVVVCNVCGVMGYAYCLQYLDALVIAVAALCEPVVAQALSSSLWTASHSSMSMLSLSSSWDPWIWLGNAMVLVGTYITLVTTSSSSSSSSSLAQQHTSKTTTTTTTRPPTTTTTPTTTSTTITP